MNKYTHIKPKNEWNLFQRRGRNDRRKGANLVVVKRQLGANFGLFCLPLGKGYDTLTGVVSKTYRAASVV
jgi:hypothetical protein